MLLRVEHPAMSDASPQAQFAVDHLVVETLEPFTERLVPYEDRLAIASPMRTSITVIEEFHHTLPSDSNSSRNMRHRISRGHRSRRGKCRSIPNLCLRNKPSVKQSWNVRLVIRFRTAGAGNCLTREA